MVLTTAGRIGIGTTLPVSKLEVKGKTTLTQQAGEDAALELKGALKVSGTNPTAFIIEATTMTNLLEIDHPSTNGNPNAIILITPRYADVDPVYLVPVVAHYDISTSKWSIRARGLELVGYYGDMYVTLCGEPCTLLIGVPHAEPAVFTSGMQFNVMVIDN